MRRRHYSKQCPMSMAEEVRVDDILVSWFNDAGFQNANHYVSRGLLQLRYELQQAVIAELMCRARGGMWRRTRATTHRLEFYEAKLRLAAMMSGTSFQQKSIDRHPGEV